MSRALAIFTTMILFANSASAFATSPSAEFWKPTDVQEFLKTFYHKDGRPVSTSELAAKLKTEDKFRDLQPGPELERSYFQLFRQWAHPLWFLHGDEDNMTKFAEAFWQRDLAMGTIAYMRVLYEQAAVFQQQTNWRRVQFQVGDNEDFLTVNELLEAMSDICSDNPGFCAVTFLRQMDQHRELLRLLDGSARDKVLEMIGFVFRHYPLPLLREGGFRSLNRIRKILMKNEPCSRLLIL